MLYSLDSIMGNKLVDVFIDEVSENKIIIAIPEIHWSVSFSNLESEQIQYKNIYRSLMFQLFQGNAQKLSDEIMKILNERKNAS
jgi:hypothetical protein